MLKPSELTPAFSALVAELVPKYLDPELYSVINGAIPETTKVRCWGLAVHNQANYPLCRFWGFSGIIVRWQLSSGLESTLIFSIVLYTGGSRVATIVLTAAAKTLSPVTTEVIRRIHSLDQYSNSPHSLQLGGKSPAVIDPKCDIKLSARRLMWGKVANAGQVRPLVLLLLMSSYTSSRPASHQIMP